MSISISLTPFGPGQAGNGRQLIRGRVTPWSDSLKSVEWRTSGGDWHPGAGVSAGGETMVPGDRFEFWVYGTRPGPRDNERMLGWEHPGGHNYWTSDRVSKNHPPVYLRDQGDLLVQKVASAATCDSTPGSWFYDTATGVLYFRDSLGRAPTSAVKALCDPVFEQNSSVPFEVQTISTGDAAATIYSETIIWPYEVRDITGHMLDVLSSPPISQSQVLRALFTSWGMGIADLYTAYDDIMLQKSVSYATWGLPIWENQVGLPTLETVPMATRRQTVKKSITASAASRAQLISAVIAIVGGATLTDTYPSYRVDLRLTLNISQNAIKALAEEFVARVKPVGIQFVLSYSSFQAGISHAGDSL